MSTESPPTGFLNPLITQRRQVAIGLVVAGLVLAALCIWWGVWGFSQTAEGATPAKSAGKLLPEEGEGDKEKSDEAKAEEAKTRHSPDYQVAAVWAGGLALLALLGAAWVFTQAPDPSAPLTSARVEVLIFGGAVGFITAMAGVFLGYRWHQSLVMWVGGGDSREARWVLYAFAIFLAGLLIMFASLQLAASEQRKNAALRRSLYGFNAVFAGILLLLILIAVNVVAFLRIPKTLVTNDSAFTALAEPSKNFLRSLDRPVHVYLIMPESYQVDLTERDTYDNLYADCRGLLSQMEDESRRFQATYLSPAFDKDRIAALMERLKIKETDRDQMGLLATVGENEDAYTFIRANDLIELDRRGFIFQGENKLLTELMYLTDTQAKEKIYFTQDHGELGIEMGAERDKSASGVVQYLRDRRMTVEPLTLDTPEAKVPEDAAVVVVAGLRRTLTDTDPMLAALKEYVRRPGKPGKLMLCLPAFRDAAGKVAATGLEGFLAEFGVEVAPDRRILAFSRTLGAPPDYLLLGAYAGLDPDLERVVGRAPQVIRDARPVGRGQAMPGGAYRVSSILGTDMVTWQERDYSRPLDALWSEIRTDPKARTDKQFSQRPVSVAVAVTQSAQAGEKSVQKPRMMVFGSDTFLNDRAVVVAGAEEFRHQLFSDSIDWLRERESSIGIPPRKLGTFALEKPIELSSQFVLLALVTVGIAVLGAGVWLSRRR